MQYLQNEDISSTNDWSKSHGCHLQTAWLRRTSSWRSICWNQGKMEDASKLFKNPKSEEDPVVLLERNLYGHPLAGLLWERPFEKILLKHGFWSGFQFWMLMRTPWKGLILLVFVDDIKLAGKKQNIDPMWKVFNKEVDLGEPTSFFDHENLGCTQRQCAICKDLVY